MSRPRRFGLSVTLCSEKASGPDSGSFTSPEKRHERADRVAPVLDVPVDGQLPADGLLPAANDQHRLTSSVQQRRDEFPKVFDDDLDLLGDVVGVQPDPAHDPLHGRAAVDFPVVQFLAVGGQLEGQLVGRVVLKHVEDELLLHGLPHRIDVERRRQIVLAGRSAGIGPGAGPCSNLDRPTSLDIG
jgi:hypothetical protein